MVNSSVGKFITFEGTEGVGKTTNIKFVEEYLKNKGFSVIVTREPGGTDLAEGIRELLLSIKKEKVEPLTELLLFNAARLQHIKRVIEPALAIGAWVLCDRFFDSTYAYQCGGRGLSEDIFNTVNNLTLGSFEPDLTFYLYADIKLGLNRVKARGKLDNFEKEDLDFFNKVQRSFDKLSDTTDRIVKVDASVSIEQVQSSLVNILEDKFF